MRNDPQPQHPQTEDVIWRLSLLLFILAFDISYYHPSSDSIVLKKDLQCMCVPSFSSFSFYPPPKVWACSARRISDFSLWK